MFVSLVGRVALNNHQVGAHQVGCVGLLRTAGSAVVINFVIFEFLVLKDVSRKFKSTIYLEQLIEFDDEFVSLG